MTTKYTPGPWSVEGPPENNAACYHEGNRFAIISECYDPDDVDHEEPMYPTIAEVWPAEGDTDRADAYLIAAAPDLYEALESLVNECRMEKVEGHYDAQGYDFAGCLAMARAALAKANGGCR